MQCHQLLVMSCYLQPSFPVVFMTAFRSHVVLLFSSLLSCYKSWLHLMLVSNSACLLFGVLGWAKCDSYWENLSSAHFRSDICADPGYTEVLETSMWIPAKWALQFRIGLLWESTVSCKIAARCIHVLQAIQQTSENYSINLSVKGGKKIK